MEGLAAHRRLRPHQARLLSGLGSHETEELKAVWSALPDPERMNLLAMLRRMAEQDALVDFDAVYEMAMEDPNADLRRLAVAAAENNRSPRLLERLLELCARDPDEMVRGAAADRLGAFAYEAEVGEFSETEAREIEQVLLDRVRSETESQSVQAAAMASAGYLSTEAVREEVRRALARPGLRVAAVRAMGRNCDPVWTEVLVEQMGSDEVAVRREAAEAAADYEGCLEALSDLVDDPDLSVRLAAISSLGKMGGAEARDVLVYCYESSDPAIKQAATEALQEIEETEDPLGSLGYEEDE